MANLEQLVRQWVDAFNRKDRSALMALYTEQATNIQPHLPHQIKGKQAIGDDLWSFLTAFPDATLTIDHLVASGSILGAEWTFTGTQTGPLVGPTGTIPPSNKKVTLKGAEFYTCDAQGLIVDERGYFDLVSFMTQLGVMPAPQQA